MEAWKFLIKAVPTNIYCYIKGGFFLAPPVKNNGGGIEVF